MLRAAFAGLLLMLPGCQTIKVQGVEITQKQQIFAAAVAVAGAIVIAHLADDDDGAGPDKCAKFVQVPPGKNGPNICAEDW